MSHVTQLEARSLFAVTAVDASFGDDGVVEMPNDLHVNDLLATHGAIYVDAENNKTGVRQIYKFNDDGSVATNWGDNGVVTPLQVGEGSAISNPLYGGETMAFDGRTNGLYLFDGVEGDGGYALQVQRITPIGKVDGNFGTNGLFSYSEGDTVLTAGKLVPLSKNRTLIAFERDESNTTRLNRTTTYTDGRDDVVLMRLDRLGRRDKTFGDRGVATVSSGFRKNISQQASNGRFNQTTDASETKFGDVQVRADGKYRVISTRDRWVWKPEGEPSRFGTRNDDFSAESTFVNADGGVVAKRSQTYLLRRERNPHVENYGPRYQVQRASAYGESGVAVLADLNGQNVVLRLRPGYRSPAAPLASTDDTVFRSTRNAAGVTFVQTVGQDVSLYASDLSPVQTWGTNGILELPQPYAEITADDEGRLVAFYLIDGQLTRLDGK